MVCSLPANSRRTGFSLIATSILLTAAALVFVSVLPGHDYNQKVMENNQKLEKIDEAMRGFMAANGRRPCPADGQYPLNTAGFGQEAANPGSCQGGAIAAPLGPDVSGNLVGGTIPTKALALSDDYAFDAFGRRFTYIVDKRATANSSCLALSSGAITIETATSGGTVLGNSVYAYISHGQSGFGAWPAQGSNSALTPAQSVASRINSGSSDADMMTNANVGSNFSYVSGVGGTFSGNLTQKPTTTTFDSMVWYRRDLAKTCALGPFSVPSGNCTLSANQGGGTLNNGNTMPTYNANQVTPPSTCPAANTLTCNNGTLSCTLSGGGAGNVNTDCAYAACAVACLLTANQGGGTLASGASTPEYNTNSVTAPATCPSANTLSCNNGTLSCTLAGGGAGNVNIDCVYSTCNQVPPGCTTPATFSPPSMSSGQSLPAYTTNSDATCTQNTLTCTSGTLTCSTGNMSNCQYASCAKTCSLTANQNGGTAGTLPGASPGNTKTEYTNSSGTCTAHTMTCTNGTPSCSTGNMTDCSYSSCAAADTGITSPINVNQAFFGSSVAVGDVNGDGWPDLIIGATGVNNDGVSGSGSVYVLYGSASGFSSAASLNGINGFRIDGATAEGLGGPVAVGDVNGDGTADLILGAPSASYNGKASSGSVYVIFGSASMMPSTTVTTTVGSKTVTVASASQLLVGQTINSANIPSGTTISAIAGNTLTLSAAATATASGTAMNIASTPTTAGGGLIDATHGFRIDGATTNDSISGGAFVTGGLAVADINGDGKSDLIIPAARASYNSKSSSGSVYVVYGGAKMKNGTAWSATNSLASGGSVINATNGFRLDGATANDWAGSSVATGDFSGDGNSDIIIGAFDASYSGKSQSGSVYVVYGGGTMKNGTAWGTTNLLTSGGTVINGTNGIRFDGVTVSESLGQSLATGDINGDGKTDLVIGTYGANDAGMPTGSQEGATYVVYGGSTMKNGTAWTAANSLSSIGSVINGTNGFRLDGASSSDWSGWSVATADVNHDGVADILTGAYSASYNGSGSGSVYLIYGGATMKSGAAWAKTATLANGGSVINGTNGVRFDGQPGDAAGSWVTAGDVNKDSFSDVIIGAPQATGSGGVIMVGKVYILYGQSATWTSPTILQ